MFTKVITGLTLTKQVANGLFQNINGQGYRDDTSFLATLRALMHKRVPEGESIFLEVSGSSFGKFDIEGAKPKNCVRSFLRQTDLMYGGANGQLVIHTFNGNEEGNTASFDSLNEGMKEAFDGKFVELPDVSKFIEQNGKFRNRVYISEERKSTVIFVEMLDHKKWHLLQSLIPRYFPWYVKDAPFDEEEVALIRSLTKRYAPEYVEKIEAFAKKFDFRTGYIRNCLAGFESAFEKDKLNQVRNNIARNERAIADLESQFSDLYKRIRDLRVQELGLIESINGEDKNEDSELMEYFLCNKSLDITYVDINNGTIEFVVKTVASNYDPDVVETALNKVGKSFFYRHYETKKSYQNTEMTDDRIHRLMKALFIDEIMKLRLCAAYRLGFKNGDYKGMRNYRFENDVLAEYTPNQHIQYYACLGNNQPHIRKAMMDRDYVAAVSNCCASAANINFTESNTGSYLMEKICANGVGKIIQMPDGSTATPLEAVKWLEEQYGEKKEEETHE